MNSVNLLGRIAWMEVADAREMLVCRFLLAVDAGKDREANFIPCVAFGKTAEFLDNYLDKGKRIAVSGHINTGSYEKDGATVRTFDVVADRVYFADGKEPEAEPEKPAEPETRYRRH